MAAGFAPPRGDGHAASASRFAALMRITVEMMTFSNALYRAPSSSLTAFGIDPARNLFGRRHREIVAGDIRKAARLEFVLGVEGVQQHFRIPIALSRAIDAWIAAQPEPRPSRPEAIRRILSQALGKPADAGSIAAEDLNASNDE
jgi:hypothetical protein